MWVGGKLALFIGSSVFAAQDSIVKESKLRVPPHPRHLPVCVI